MRLPPIGVLCGGVATRLGPIAGQLPKSLVPVAGEPFLAHQLRRLARGGFSRVVLLVGHRGGQIRAFAGDGRRFGIEVVYSDDGDARLGTGGAVRKALRRLGDQFFITYGDSLLDFDPVAMWQCFCDGDAPATMAVFHNRDRWGQSNVIFDGTRVRCHDKTVTAGLLKPEWIDWGMTIFTAETIRDWPEADPFDLAAVTKDLAATGRLTGFPVDNRFYEIGSPTSLAETEAFLIASGVPPPRRAGTSC